MLFYILNVSLGLYLICKWAFREKWPILPPFPQPNTIMVNRLNIRYVKFWRKKFIKAMCYVYLNLHFNKWSIVGTQSTAIKPQMPVFFLTSCPVLFESYAADKICNNIYILNLGPDIVLFNELHFTTWLPGRTDWLCG